MIHEWTTYVLKKGLNGIVDIRERHHMWKGAGWWKVGGAKEIQTS